ncbi:hypothetical protein BDZ45DRAFT_727815 [Acephala macrosclerotiorum]|nr:hypothetical protein BDZ45DRAFT_727815 [Acephala macrosclerotiorum]
MNSLTSILLSFSALALAQLDAIPSCAQSCFSHVADETNCIIDGVLDPTCFCTSYCLSLTNGGHSTGQEWVYQYCIFEKEACSNSDAGDLSSALNDLCYNADASPKYNCGVIPGSPVPATPSVTPTGSVVETWDGGYLATMPVYPDYTTIMVTSMVYKETTFTETYQSTTSTIVTDYPLYQAVCPIRATVGIPLSYTAPANSLSYNAYTTNTGNLYSQLTSAAASASKASAIAAAQVTTSSPTLRTSSSSATSTIGSVNGTSTATGTKNAPASTVSKALAGDLKEGLRAAMIGGVALGAVLGMI